MVAADVMVKFIDDLPLPLQAGDIPVNGNGASILSLIYCPVESTTRRPESSVLFPIPQARTRDACAWSF
jgi:hypothetical protein